MKTYILTTLVAVLAASYPASAHSERFTIDDFQNLKIIKEFKVTPTKDVILSVRELENREKWSYDLYLLRDKRISRLTYQGKGSGSFDISKDGRYVYLVYTKDDKTILSRLPLTAGEPETLMEFPQEIDNLKTFTRSDKDYILFTSDILLECEQDEIRCTKEKMTQYKKTTSAYVYDSLYMRPWNTYRERRRSALFLFDIEKRTYKRVISGDFDTPPLPFGGRDDFDISPDGRYIAYAAKKVKNIAESTNIDIFEFDTVLQTEIKVSHSSGADMHPTYSPNGRYIAFMTQKTDGFESDKIEMAIYDRRDKSIKTMTSHIDNWVKDFRWTTDSNGIYTLIEERGYNTLYYISLEKPQSSLPLSEKDNIKRVIVTKEGLFVGKDSILAPEEVFFARITAPEQIKATLKFERLTDLNSDILKKKEMPEISDITYDGARRQEAGGHNRVQAFLLKPKNIERGKRPPVVVMIHGGPQGSWLNSFHPRWNALMFASMGYIVVMPNITGSTGFGQQFVNEVSRDWGGAPYEDIMGIFSYLEKSGIADPDRVCAIGGSYGGYLTNWILGHTDRFRCLVSHAAPFNLISKYGSTDELWFPEWEFGGTPWTNRELYEKFSPHNYVKQFKTPTLIIHGANDFRVPLEQALNAFTYLQKMNVESRLIIFPDEDHFIKKPHNQRFWYTEVESWLNRYLK